MNKKIIFISVGSILFSIFIINRYDTYKKIKTLSDNNVVFLDLERPVKNYYIENNRLPTKEKLIDLINQEKEYNMLKYFICDLNWGVKNYDSSIVVYFYGYDNDDDQLNKHYQVDDISFVESIFIDGDFLMLDLKLKSLFKTKKSIFYKNLKPPLPAGAHLEK
jgi:hypothetical protein